MFSDLSWVFLKNRERETKAKMNGNSKWLKGPPVVLQLSVVREGHAGSVWRREAERGRAGGDYTKWEESDDKKELQLSSACHMFQTTTPLRDRCAVLCVCVRVCARAEGWRLSFDVSQS